MSDSTNDSKGKPVSRRSFLHTTSSAVVGGSILGALPIERVAFGDQHTDTLKLALIGCGGRGTGAANQALNTKGNVKLVAMADAFQHRLDSSLKNLKQQHPDRIDVPADRQFTGLNAYKKAIQEADVVILTTPPGFRPMQLEEAVRQGKHIFMEKPVAVDAPGIRRVLAAGEEAERKGLKIGVGLQRHHHQGYIETVDRLQNGAIGDIVSMRCYWNGGGVWTRTRDSLAGILGRSPTEMEYQVNNWYYFVWTCGDHIVEQHIHNIDVINWIKGAYPVSAQGMGGREVRTGNEHGQIFDHHFVEFEYADGSRMYSQCRHIRGCWSNVSEHVTGTKGHADVSSKRIWGENAWQIGPWSFSGNAKNPYQQEHDDLFHAIRNDLPFNEVEYGAKSTMTAIYGRMCTYSGKKITWDEAFNSDLDHSPDSYSWNAQPPVLPNDDGSYPVPVPGETAAL